MNRHGALVIAVQLAFVAAVPSIDRAAEADDQNPLQLEADHATASVADLDKESAWYERVLGFRELSRNQGADFGIRHLGIPGYRIDLAWQNGSSRPGETTGYQKQGWLHVVFRTDAVDADYKRLVELGTDVKADRTQQGTVTRLVFHDPEGNELEIVPRKAP
jgi:catechol 2,3-dioxygenase-like lactoylglutathione lyase family enzyme